MRFPLPNHLRVLAAIFVVLTIGVSWRFISQRVRQPVATLSRLEEFLQSDYPVEMENVESNRASFSAKVSFAPLCSPESNVAGAIYKSEVVTSTYVTNGSTFLMPVGEPNLMVMNREVTYARLSADGLSVRVTEAVSIPGDSMISKLVAKGMSTTQVIAADGRYVDPSVDSSEQSTMDPMFISKEVTTGSKWEQEFPVDPSLNPSGRGKKTFEVLCVYIKAGEKYVRVSSFCRFRSYRPGINPETGASTGASADVMTNCTREVLDICLPTGVVVEKGVVSRVYSETNAEAKAGLSPQQQKDSLNVSGSVVETKMREKLVEVIARK